MTEKTEPVRVKLWVDTQYVGTKREDEVEIEREGWDDRTQDERIEYLDELAAEFRDEFVDYGWHIADPADAEAAGGA